MLSAYKGLLRVRRLPEGRDDGKWSRRYRSTIHPGGNGEMPGEIRTRLLDRRSARVRPVAAVRHTGEAHVAEIVAERDRFSRLWLTIQILQRQS